MTSLKSSLSRYQGKSPMNEEEMLLERKRVYETTGSVLLTHDDIAKQPAYVRMIIEGIAVQLFGQQRKKK